MEGSRSDAADRPRGRGAWQLLAGATGDSVGDDSLRTVVPLLAVAVLGASGWFVGLLNAVPFIWFLIGAGVIGRGVDRIGAKRATMFGSGLRAAAVFALVVLWATGMLSAPVLLVVMIVVGFGDAVFSTGHSTLVPSVMGANRTAWCYQRIEAVGSLTRVGSPLLVSWILRAASYPAVLVLSAASYLASLVSTALLRSDAATLDADETTSDASDSAPWGIKKVLTTRGLGGTTSATALLNASAMFSGTALVFFALEELGLAPATVALFAAAGAFGGLVGAGLVSPLRRLSTGTGKLLATVGVAVSSLIPPAALLVPAQATWVVLGGEFLVAMFVTAASVVGSDVPALLVPQHRLGSAFGSIRFVTVGITPVASLIAGLAVSALGSMATLIVGAGIALLACLPLLGLRGWSPPRPPA